MHPETPEEGLSLEKLFAGKDIDIPAAMARLRSVAQELNLPWGDRQMTYNSRLAQELGKWAEEKGKGEEFHRTAFRAYFAEGRNIARKEVLIELACRAGLPGEEARDVLVSRSFRPAVDEDWQLSRAWGISAVPTFVMAQGRVVGAQPLNVMEQFMYDNFVQARKTRGEES